MSPATRCCCSRFAHLMLLMLAAQHPHFTHMHTRHPLWLWAGRLNAVWDTGSERGAAHSHWGVGFSLVVGMDNSKKVPPHTCQLPPCSCAVCVCCVWCASVCACGVKCALVLATPAAVTLHLLSIYLKNFINKIALFFGTYTIKAALLKSFMWLD
jgi:hypothetical protein